MSSLFSQIKANEFIKNVLTLVSATSIAQAIALFIYPVLSRIYTPAEHGFFALYMSIISITAIISTGKYELATMLPKNEEEGASITFLSILISFAVSIIFLLIIVFFNNKILLLLGCPELKNWLWFVPLSTFLVGLFQSINYWSNRNKYYRNIAGANLSQSISNSAVKLSTSNVLSGGGGLILGAIIGQVTGAMYFLNRLIKRDLQVFKRVNLGMLKKSVKRYSLFPKYNMPHSLANNFSSSLPIFVISSFFTPEFVGYYSFGFMMINRPMNLLTASFTQVFSQKIIELFNNGQEVSKKIKGFVKRLLLIAILPFSLAAIFGPTLFTIIFGENWVEAGIIMRILLPWLFVVFLSSPLSFLPDMLSRQKMAMWIDFIKFFLRIIALGIGVKMNDIYVALYFFSGISFILVTISLFWYVNLSVKADRLVRKK